MTDIRRGRVIFLLFTLIILNLTYPISEYNDMGSYIYVFSYAALLWVGVYVVAVTRTRFLITSPMAIFVIVLGILWNADPQNQVYNLSIYSGLLIFQSMLIYLLLEYIFLTQKVNNDVLFAAVSVYILMGDTFIPVYMIVDILTREWMNQGAFVMASAPDAAVTWQNMSYYSFVTLSSTGYGDILPVTSVARSIAAFQATTGLLFIAVLIGRLVGLYSQAEEKPA